MASRARRRCASCASAVATWHRDEQDEEQGTAAQVEVVRERNRGRPGKDVFEAWRHLETVAREETPRVGLWLDTSDQTPAESANAILRRAWHEAIID